MTRWKIASLVAAFLISAGITAAETDSYLLSPIRIAECGTSPPRPGDVLIKCWSKAQGFYYSGAIFLNVDRELVEGLRAADVVVFGNSRTVRTFRAGAIDEYFKRKGLSYFVLAGDGSGFRFAQMLLEKTGTRPKILLVSNESFYVDVLEDTYREFVLSPDRFYPAFVAFYYSKRMQDWICRSSFGILRRFYCHGTEGEWRSTINGTEGVQPRDTPGYFPVRIPPESRMHFKPLFMANARAFLASPSAKGACLIEYLIPSNAASVDLARSMAADLKAPFVFPQVDDLHSFDGSHLLPESSERWASEFVKELDPSIDRCLKRNSA
jgi:hypothetical protein